MPDLVGDPRLADVNQPVGPNPLHDDDPSNDDQAEAWLANANLWREWAARQDEAIAKLVQEGAELGQSAEQTLTKAGFQNRKEYGKHAFTMYGTGGYYSQMGAAADPGWEYDWARGVKRNMGTDDLSARDRWVPINATEFAERAKAQNYAKAGVNDYGMQANAEAFKRAVKTGHFHQDPKTGNWYSGSSPEDPNNNWTDSYGRKINGRQGLPTGQSFSGQPLYGSGGYSEDPYGGGGYGGYSSAFGGGGFSPGMDAAGFAQADLSSAQAEMLRNDILAQQLSLQKGLEGRALGQGIYDYMLNEVYGPVLGAQFSGNKQGVSQFAQGLQMGTPTQYETEFDPNNPWNTGEWDPSTGWFKGQPTASQPESIARYQEQKQGGEGGMQEAEYDPWASAEWDPETGWFKAMPSQSEEESIGGYAAAKAAGRAPAGATDQQALASSAFSDSDWGRLAEAATAQDRDPDYVEHPDKGSNTTPGMTGPGGVAVGISNAVLQGATSDDPRVADAYQKAIASGMPEGDAAAARAFLDQMKREGIISDNQYAQKMQALQSITRTTKTPGQPVQALGTPLPTGSYTQTGTDALDPNMSNTWARFLAPTWGKVNEASQQQQQALERAMPRGGELDRAKAGAISQRYGALQGQWQSMVPTALQGISDIGKEMYHQQMTPYAGALQNATTMRGQDMQQQLGLEGLKTQEKIGKQQADAAKWGAIGGGVSSLLTAPFSGGTSLLGKLGGLF